MATVAYLVLEGAFTHDNNYYSSSPGGYPNKLFLCKEEAEEYADQIGLETFKELVLSRDIFEYGYGDCEGVFDVNDTFEVFLKDKLKTDPIDWWDNFDTYSDDTEEKIELSDEDWKTFYDFCTLRLAYVQEVGFGDVFS